MSDQERHLPIVDQIAKQYGGVIDLDRSPFVMVEILRNFGHALDDDDNGGGGGGGVGGGVSTIAVGITPPEFGEDIQLIDVMRVLLGVQRDLAQLQGASSSSSRRGGTPSGLKRAPQAPPSASARAPRRGVAR
jgi:hypothetical protein